MIVAMHQPNYIPWIGFFHKMALSDRFVIVDDVQYSMGSFTNRNKVKGSNGEIMLTVPLKNKAFQLINEIEIFNSNWRRKHLNSLKLAYSNSPFYKKYIGLLEEAYSQDCKYLAELNINLIHLIKNQLNIKTEILLSSEIGKTFSSKNDRIVGICKYIGATSFLFGSGTKKYIDKNLFHSNGIEIVYQEFVHPVYQQLWGDFIPNLSILDLLFNCGDRSLDIIMSRSGKG